MTLKNIISGFLLVIISTVSNAQKVPADSLMNWSFYGVGVAKVDHQQVYLKEYTNSVGVTLLSPKPYDGNIVMRYKLMPLTAATVCVAMLNVHNNEDYNLEIPDYYNGYVQFWTLESSGYFFAFHNMAHNQPPFVRRCDKVNNSNIKLQTATENAMTESKYYDIEVGKKNNRVWLKVNNEIVLDVKDTSATYEKGYLALRIRGTADELASCLIKDLEIIEN